MCRATRCIKGFQAGERPRRDPRVVESLGRRIPEQRVEQLPRHHLCTVCHRPLLHETVTPEAQRSGAAAAARGGRRANVKGGPGRPGVGRGASRSGSRCCRSRGRFRRREASSEEDVRSLQHILGMKLRIDKGGMRRRRRRRDHRIGAQRAKVRAKLAQVRPKIATRRGPQPMMAQEQSRAGVRQRGHWIVACDIVRVANLLHEPLTARDSHPRLPSERRQWPRVAACGRTEG